MLVGHLAGHADVVADVGNVGGGQDDVPVEVAMPGPGIQPAHGAVRCMRRFRAAREVKPLQVSFPPRFGKQQLGFVEDQEGTARSPLKPRAHALQVREGFEVQVDDFGAGREFGEHRIGAFQGETAHVGDDDAAFLECRYGIVLNRAGSLVGAVGAVVNLDRHGLSPHERHEAHAEARRQRAEDDVEGLRHAEEREPCGHIGW
ncbi:hypothetical protein D9M68_594310 [compost metagenome]